MDLWLPIWHFSCLINSQSIGIDLSFTLSNGLKINHFLPLCSRHSPVVMGRLILMFNNVIMKRLEGCSRTSKDIISKQWKIWRITNIFLHLKEVKFGRFVSSGGKPVMWVWFIPIPLQLIELYLTPIPQIQAIKCLKPWCRK